MGLSFSINFSQARQIMEVTAAAVCFGVGLLLKLSSGSKKETSKLLRRAVPIYDLKGLGEFIEYKRLEYPPVLVRGTVGSTSTVENSSLGVFIREKVSIATEKMNVLGKVVPERKTITVSRKEVPWYLEDGTAQVYVRDYQGAIGFYATLNEYFSTEPVTTYVKFLGSDDKEKMVITNADCRKCQQVLEIGTELTVVGWAVRDKDGAPMIRYACQFFKGHIQLEEFVADLESDSARSGAFSLCLIALGVFFLGLKISQLDANDLA